MKHDRLMGFSPSASMMLCATPPHHRMASGLNKLSRSKPRAHLSSPHDRMADGSSHRTVHTDLPLALLPEQQETEVVT